MKLDHLLTPHIRINSNWIKILNVRHKIIKIIEANRGSKISDIAHNNVLLDISPLERETKEQINKWDYIKPKSFFTAKEIIKKIKRQPTAWENIFNNTSDKGLMSKTHKELIKFNTKNNKQCN